MQCTESFPRVEGANKSTVMELGLLKVPHDWQHVVTLINVTSEGLGCSFGGGLEHIQYSLLGGSVGGSTQSP